MRSLWGGSVLHFLQRRQAGMKRWELHDYLLADGGPHFLELQWMSFIPLNPRATQYSCPVLLLPVLSLVCWSSSEIFDEKNRSDEAPSCCPRWLVGFAASSVRHLLTNLGEATWYMWASASSGQIQVMLQNPWPWVVMRGHHGETAAQSGCEGSTREEAALFFKALSAA